MKSPFSFAFVLLLSFIVSGCSKGVPVVKVEGRLLMDGQPVEGATLTFLPVDDSAYSAVGRSGPGGNFSLSTSGAKVGGGAVPGKYHVGITYNKCLNPVPESEFEGLTSEQRNEKARMFANDPRYFPPQYQTIVPVRYNRAKESGIEVEIKSKGSNDITLEIQGE